MDELPAELLGEEILPHVAEYAPALRQVCRGWLSAAAKLPARTTRKRGLTFLAERGHVSLIVWVREQRVRRDFMQPQVDAMFAAACRGGSSPLVDLLHDWGVNDPGPAFVEAARQGHVELVVRLRRWGNLSSHSIERGIRKAARSGHYDLIVSHFKWGGTIDHQSALLIDVILMKAARGGHLDIMRWARSKGAGSYCMAFYEAARGGQLETMVTLQHWYPMSVSQLNEAVIAAAQSGGRASFELLRSWGASNVEELRGAARYGNRELLALFLASGAQNVDLMLEGAVEGGHEDICRQARALGARANSQMFMCAAELGHAHLLPIIRDWILEEEARAIDPEGRSFDELGHAHLLPIIRDWTLEEEEARIIDPEGRSFDELLLCEAFHSAILESHLEVAELLRSWGATCHGELWPGIFGRAAAAGDLAMLRRLKEWFGGDAEYPLGDYVDELLFEAASRGEEDAMHLLREWGAEDFGHALAGAASDNQVRAMHLLKEWGLDEFDLADALDLANANTNREAEQLLRSWGAQLEANQDGPAIAALAPADPLLAEAVEELLEAFAAPDP